MYIDSKVEFYPGLSITATAHFDDEAWFTAWKRRLRCYYFNPAQKILGPDKGFAVMVLTCAGIEAMASILATQPEPGPRFHSLANDIYALNEEACRFLYTQYRCGLIHNGRTNQAAIRNARHHRTPNVLSVMDPHQPQVLAIEKRGDRIFISVNPNLFAKEARRYLSDLNFNAELAKKIRQEFEPDIALAQEYEIAKRSA